MDEQLEKVLKFMPSKVRSAVISFARSVGGGCSEISEIRLRADAPMSVTFGGQNRICFQGTTVICTADEIEKTLQRLCEDSVHTHTETLRDGFVMLENGYRIGVCGRASLHGDNMIKSVYGFTSLSVRIPHPVCNVCAEILPYLVKENGRVESALFYAQPGVGKTTLIRDLAAKLSSGENAKRVALIDTRGELYMRALFKDCIADVLHGYPRAKGIEIATRTLSPELVFCDEIGSLEEANAILSAENCGVPLIATAHGETLSDLLRRPNIRVLYESKVFRYYIGLKREARARRFSFAVHDVLQSEVDR